MTEPPKWYKRGVRLDDDGFQIGPPAPTSFTMNYFLNLKSVTPKEMVKGQSYLCGRTNLPGDQIDWICCEFNGEALCPIHGILLGEPINFDEEFMCSPDGCTSVYLMFELPVAPWEPENTPSTQE